MATSWLDFWNGQHRIYVNDRHAEVHYRKIAADFIALIPAPGATVVDWGCGDAFNAEDIVSHAGKLVLCDAASSTRQRLIERFGARTTRIDVVSPEDLRRRYSGTVDLFVVNSVLQYLDDAELDQLLADARRVLAPGGRLIIADVIPTHDDLIGDIRNLLGTGLRHGFFLAAIIGMAATFFSPYRRLRSTVGLQRHDAEAFLQRLGAAGFQAARFHPNMGFDQRRMAFEARIAT
jgi:ubiquinone/menaquinone biosynthesis C-methylase UbiE